MGSRIFLRSKTLCWLAIARNLHYTRLARTAEHSAVERTELKQPQRSVQVPLKSKETSAGDSVQVNDSNYKGLMDSVKTQSQLSNREQYAMILNEFVAREKYRKGHVSFINMAMERMEEFQLEKDLVTYNRILDIFPKGRFKPKRLLDAIWPRPLPQTELALELLTRMEDNYVWPDDVTYNILVQVFGKHSLPVERCDRMIYWYNRYKDVDPYWLDDVPTEPEELSRHALKRIINDTNVIQYDLPSVDDSNYILSGEMQDKVKLLDTLDDGSLLYVEGPHRIWINKTPVHYFSLRLATDVGNESTGEGAVVAVCSCQPGTQSSLQRWIKQLESTYPPLTMATIVYDIRTEEPSSPLLEENSRSLLAGDTSDLSLH